MKPYEHAVIAVESVPVADLVPLAKYVLEEQPQYLTRLRHTLNTAGIDIPNLTHALAWPDNEGERPIAPPIVSIGKARDSLG